MPLVVIPHPLLAQARYDTYDQLQTGISDGEGDVDVFIHVAQVYWLLALLVTLGLLGLAVINDQAARLRARRRRQPWWRR